MSLNAQQRGNVMTIMLDGRWRTLFELESDLKSRGYTYLTTSISARLRELRNPDYGEWIVERRTRPGSSDRVQEYRVLPPKPAAMPGVQQEMFA